MRNFLVSILLAFSCLFVSAGERVEVQPIEGGLNFGITPAINKLYGGTPKVGLFIGFELRYNIPNTNFDFGVYGDIKDMAHRYNVVGEEDGVAYSDRFDVISNVNSYGFVAHYNFGQGKKINPFVGLGLGLTHCQWDGEYMGTTLATTPRFGVELFHHLRISFQFEFNSMDYNSASISVGFVIGGRPKKAK
jgi:opacity protein-like surface antigen